MYTPDVHPGPEVLSEAPFRDRQEPDAVAAHLPFRLDDTRRVNQAFLCWRRQGLAEAKRIVDLWTYCYIRRYFLVKFTYQASCHPSDYDELVDRVYRRVEAKQDGIRDAARYASWVSVVCKHAFCSYLRRRRKTVFLGDACEVPLQAEGLRGSYDENAMGQGLRAAIRRLPPFLQEVARLYFLSHCTYADIACATGKPSATIRAYVNKARQRFRKDPCLLALMDRPCEAQQPF